MPEDRVHPLEYEPPRPPKPRPLNSGDAWILALGTGLLAGGFGAAIDSNLRGPGPILMGIGGFLLAAVLPVLVVRDGSR